MQEGNQMKLKSSAVMAIALLVVGFSFPLHAQTDDAQTDVAQKVRVTKPSKKKKVVKKTTTTTETTTTETRQPMATPTPVEVPPETPTVTAPAPTPEPTPVEEKKNVFQKTGDAVGDAAHSAGQIIGGGLERRSNSNFIVLANYSPFDMIVTNKIGATAGWVQNGNTTYELEYLRGSISVPIVIQDLGAMTDQRISLIRRSFFGSNSFNVSYGISYFDFNIHLGEALLNRASAGNIPSIDAVTMQSMGANFAIGNRWSFTQNITFGVDWFSWAQPLVTLKRDSAFTQYSANSGDRNDVDTALKVLSYLPRFAVLKLQLGMMF
jgi:hypothetical protein